MNNDKECNEVEYIIGLNYYYMRKKDTKVSQTLRHIEVNFN